MHFVKLTMAALFASTSVPALSQESAPVGEDAAAEDSDIIIVTAR